MSVLIWVWILLMESHASEVIRAHSGGAVHLTSDLQLQLKQDVRWTHPDLLVSLKNNMTACPHGRCQLLHDGSLRFSRVQPGDSGNYSLQVYEEDGTRVLRRDFLLLVESSQLDLNSRSVLVTVLILLFLLLFIIIILFVLNRKRRQQIRRSGPLEDNLYVEMHSHRGNKREEDECHYVPCNPAVPVEKPIPAQSSEETVYM